MAYDPGLAQILRDALADLPITEKMMFGGLAFLLHGHMVCGVHKGGAMVRVMNASVLLLPARRPSDGQLGSSEGKPPSNTQCANMTASVSTPSVRQGSGAVARVPAG